MSKSAHEVWKYAQKQNLNDKEFKELLIKEGIIIKKPALGGLCKTQFNMSKLTKRIIEYYMFHCPGCNYKHSYVVSDNGWQFNGDMENPSFTPSLLNTQKDEDGKVVSICHLFITNGNIIYCGDCTHELKGQTVKL